MSHIKPLKLSAFALLVLAGCSATVQAQVSTQKEFIKAPAAIVKKAPVSENELKRWSHLDLLKDSIPGMSVDKAYAELLQGKKGQKVIVGIVDSGVDIEHEDLKGMIWTNPKEIPGNGIDDDKNGFIDDVNGWNFLGDAVHENLELTRIVKKGDDGSAQYKAALAQYTEKYEEALQDKQQVDFLLDVHNTIKKELNKTTYKLEDLSTITSADPKVLQSKKVMTQIFTNAGSTFDPESELKEYGEQVYDQLNYNLNKEFDGRKIVGDNPEDIKNTRYGNNIVFGPDKEKALHGTHVAGIIAQIRGNNLGGDGVTNNVEILTVRAVPDGDEYDKDIALAIRYAVDNGAKVINGSFGKSFSPHKQWVYDAIKYAAKKDVLIVHAAGNDGYNIDETKNINYPNDSEDNVKEFADNVITIGAINKQYGENVVAGFSNFGKINVDVFAPGEEIYATVPNNKYKFLQGTSMASPNAAGVAALIRSYYPKLKASQVKHILMDSGVALPAQIVLGKGENPGEKPAAVSSAESSKTAKMVNAYNALLMAEKMSKK
ncbi:S8 family peptidase [Flavobacterium johnsoniae]|jgi:subtilisin family serine protease|uniref:Peptidase families S8 and S53, subtilisin, kexin, sedolisin n=1 Tax=Flavobacterium johnsoniae (strain ATCC 17061 / DSM 2064 / JCM 8514 / BCRC 14874 / CCUG 350202 / NBRC 14942 / NCIMB 11054 / UW101) TaxID=376686 RepID=A5FKP7_FLAJ1|nr:S8 family peptidase [Flavobacterium johnsoniae]ABQ04222.1 peptidase families S8 and S53, subtilisin, kexin, sedolisin [Flavobacterium johnsoniae UW101]OXG02547.1 peptidase S8 [Flavobacterium johnsoniae UW101]WQG83983.1 S8 family peptidase [Flavobacterium johnsoniae UW101]SHK16175.1 Subtilase family protein [Flavobacterium johnsoniae]